MANCLHGPYRSAKNFQTIGEAAEHLAENISQEAFEELQDCMAADLGVDPDDDVIPQQPSDIPKLPCIRNLPLFVTYLNYLINDYYLLMCCTTSLK